MVCAFGMFVCACVFVFMCLRVCEVACLWGIMDLYLSGIISICVYLCVLMCMCVCVRVFM